MAPRGRSRKVGTKRIDAALEAMGRMGFPKSKVRSTMNKLLRVYGGVEGYPFIEEYSYRVLTDVLTEEEEKKYWEAQSVEVQASTKQGQGDSLENQRVGDESHDSTGPAGENAGSSNYHSPDTPLQTDLVPAEGDGNRGEDDLDGLSLLASIASSLKPQSSSTRRRSSPRNGWIEDDDDDDDVADDWVSLPPAVNEVPTPLPAAVQLRRSKRIKRLEAM